MNCEDYLLILDEYVENELDVKGAAKVSAHIADCADCAGEYEILRRERLTYLRYLTNIEAKPKLWANVQADIEKIHRERLSTDNFRDWFAKTLGVPAFNPAFAAASVALLITFGIIFGLIKYKSAENSFSEEVVSKKTDVQPAPQKTVTVDESKTSNLGKKDNLDKTEEKVVTAQVKNRTKKDSSRSDLSKPANKIVNFNRKPTTDEIVEKAERQYKSAIAVLSDDIKRRRSALSANLNSQFEQTLADVDRTINETRRAVKAQPNDPVAIQYMTSAYTKKIELLRTIAGSFN